jgi:hypothetical protein
MPHYFYIYYISSNDFAAILDYKGWNLLICMGYQYKSVADSSYSLPSGEGNFHSNVPPRRHSAYMKADSHQSLRRCFHCESQLAHEYDRTT